MTTRDAATELRRNLEEDGYVRPDYAGRSIANLPDSVAAILDAPADRPLPSSILAPAVEAREAPIEHVVLVVVDGFGWDRFVELRDGMAPLSRLAERATVSPLTSTYPSETAAAMITLYTGLQPIEHGQLGWFSFFPAVDVVGLSLPFTTRSGTPLDEAHGIDRSALFETAVRRTVGERLRDAGVRTHHVAPAAIVDSPSSRQVDPSTRRVGYETVDGGFEAVADALAAATAPSYTLVYYPDVDAAAHRHGTRSAPYVDAVERGVRAIHRHLLDGLDGDTARRTLVLVVADHGLIDTDPETNLRLSDVAASAGIDLDALLRRDADGRRCYPAGSPRNVQLYAAEGRAPALRDGLSGALDARVFDEESYRATDLFGDRAPAPTFDARAPDVVVVPRATGLWYDDGELDLIGMHGGMHPREMLVPLLALRPA